MYLEKTNKLYIRVDINNTIATGHLMRCLAIAEKAKDYNIETIFINADNEGTNLINEKGFKNIVLNTIWDDLDKETDILVDVIKKNEIKILLLDTYKVTYDYLSTIRKYTKTVYIDDLNEMKYPVDILISYCNYYQKFNYNERYNDTKLLLGTKYVPLRKEFSSPSKKTINKTIKEILIISGGTDNYHVIEKILKKINSDYLITCICGRYNTDFDKLKEIYKEKNNIFLYKNVNNIEEYMKKVDVVISAGGTTLYELCACGTPTITYSIADNQLDNVNSFNDEKIMFYAGDFRKDDVSNNILKILKEYTYNFRNKVSISMQNKVDSKGTERIIEEIMKLK